LLILLLTSTPGFDRYRFFRTPVRADLGAATVSLPTELSCGMVFLNVQVDGRSPRWFMLDTGSGVLILDGRDYSRDSFSRSHLSLGYSGMGYRQGWKPTGPIDELTIGGARFERVSAVFLPNDDIFAKLEAFTGRNIGGVIGSNVFASLTLTIDYASELAQASTIPLGSIDDLHVLSIEWIEAAPGILVGLGEQVVPAMIDTARTGPPFMGAALAAPRVDRLIHSGSTKNAFGEEFSTQTGVLVTDIQFGSFSFERPVVDVAAAGGPWAEDKLNLGESILKWFSISLDYPNGRVQFKPNDSEVAFAETPYWSTGVTLDYDQDGIFVSHLIPDTPGSRSGLETGEFVVEINGEPVEGFCARTATSAISRTDPGPVTYGVRRNGTISEITVPQVRLLP